MGNRRNVIIITLINILIIGMFTGCIYKHNKSKEPSVVNIISYCDKEQTFSYTLSHIYGNEEFSHTCENGKGFSLYSIADVDYVNIKADIKTIGNYELDKVMINDEEHSSPLVQVELEPGEIYKVEFYYVPKK